MNLPKPIAALTLSLLLGCPSTFAADASAWVPLFNGKDLSNWQIKFTGYPLGENFRNTFRVEDGLLKVSYDQWNDFDGQFGHLYTTGSYSRYQIRVEYRFVGEQVVTGPAWAFRNNGVMLHTQSPESLILDQEFPVSIEAQMLGGNGSDPRTNGNVCTPGTHIVMGGQLITQHCTNSNSGTFHGDQWVTIEIEVLGADSVRHFVNGEEVIAYSDIQLDPSDPDAQRLLAAGAPLELAEGHIAIQAETHPIEIREIELLALPAEP